MVSLLLVEKYVFYAKQYPIQDSVFNIDNKTY